MHDDGAVDPERFVELHQVVIGAVFGRVAALFAERKFGLRAEDVDMGIAGTTRHHECRPLRMAIGAGAGLRCGARRMRTHRGNSFK